MPNQKKKVGKKIQNKEKNKKYVRKCIYLLQTQKIRFCLKLKEENVDCPPKCPFFVNGEVGCYKDTEEIQYDIKCLYFTRKKVIDKKNNEISKFHCTLFNSQPFCAMCQFILTQTEDYNFMEIKTLKT